ncbi:energy transducer TonB [Pseudoalteromonas arctica]|uniref:energy transducer TonB n=1 Tax=Pseudoalteromonas arctica TaxID=394751 RepID=UPI00249582BB|nr:energy transducer TonB [Pseudoalteromonas arctica]
MRYLLVILFTLLSFGCASTSNKPSVKTDITFNSTPGPVVKVTPLYSMNTVKLGVSGIVIAKFVVGDDGKAEDISIIESAHELLSSPTKAAIERALYLPKYSGKVVEATATFTINKSVN